MKKLDYILSYLYPVSVETATSPWNPFLEIELSGGRYSLNSENTNYSFGSLHTLFERTFRKLNLDWQGINEVLILGFGTGSVAEIIRKYKHDCKIDGVEIDRKVIELGEKYFNTGALENVTIHCAAADTFITDCRKKYDLVVIDVYLDLNVPEELETRQFLTSLKNVMKPGGSVVFNKFVHSGKNRQQLPLLKALYEKTFANVNIITVMRTGKIFVAKNN